MNFRIPFTIQRIAELVTQPKEHYKRTDKFLRGIEKVSIFIIMQTVVSNLKVLFVCQTMQ